MLIGFRRNERYVYDVCGMSLAKMPVCFMESRDGNDCGDFRGVNALTPLIECRDDISAHLKRFHLSNEDVLEYHLILARAGHFCLRDEKVGEMFVCPKHRGGLGKYWYRTKSVCQHPEHKGKLEGVKGDRVFNVRLSKDVFDVFGIIIPIGSREYHLKSGKSFHIV